MRDIVFVLLTVGFFALASGAVALCDRVVGPDPVPERTREEVPS